MSRVTVELTGDEARLLRAIDRVIAKERQLGQEMGRATEQSSRGAKEAGGALTDMDRQLGALMRSGRNALAVFGIGGGFAGAVTGAVSLIASEAEKARKSLEALGQLRLETGRGELGLGTIGGAGAPGAVDRLAAELGLPKEKVAQTYGKFAGMGISPEAAASQTRRELVESLGGPGYEKRRAETVAASPQAALAELVRESETRAGGSLRAPRSREAAMRLARADIAAAEKQIRAEAAAQAGYQSPEDIGFFALGEQTRQQLRERALMPEFRSRMGLPAVPAAGSLAEAKAERLSREGALMISESDVETIAQKLLDAAEAQKRAAEGTESAQRSPRG